MIAINQGGNDDAYYDPQYLITVCTILYNSGK